MTYNKKYERLYLAQWHDNYDPLRRWLNNYAQNRLEAYLGDDEILVIEERKFFTSVGKERRRYVATISRDFSDTLARTLDISPGAPPPPTFYCAPKQKRSLESLLHEREWHRALKDMMRNWSFNSDLDLRRGVSGGVRLADHEQQAPSEPPKPPLRHNG